MVDPKTVKMCMDALNKSDEYSDVSISKDKVISFKYDNVAYDIRLCSDYADMVILYCCEIGYFDDDESTLDFYREINDLNKRYENINVFLVEELHKIVFNVQVRADNEEVFLQSLDKELFELKNKVEFYLGGYVDELVDEMPCISCRHHILKDNMSQCKLGNITDIYIVKSYECYDYEDWTGDDETP